MLSRLTSHELSVRRRKCSWIAEIFNLVHLEKLLSECFCVVVCVFYAACYILCCCDKVYFPMGINEVIHPSSIHPSTYIYLLIYLHKWGPVCSIGSNICETQRVNRRLRGIHNAFLFLLSHHIIIFKRLRLKAKKRIRSSPLSFLLNNKHGLQQTAEAIYRILKLALQNHHTGQNQKSQLLFFLTSKQ